MATENRRVALPAGMRRVYGELDRAQVVMTLHNLARRVGILADSLLAAIPVPAAGSWDVRLIELYCAASEVILRVPGVASMLQTRTSGESAQRLDHLSRSLLAEAGLAKAPAAAAHTVLYTYVLGSVSLEESRSLTPAGRDTRHAAARFRSGLDVIIAGIRASAVW